MVESVTAPDAATVVFRLRYPYAPFLQRLTLGIVPAKLLSGQDINTAGFNRKPVGTGPYRVESWTPGDRLVLTANETLLRRPAEEQPGGGRVRRRRQRPRPADARPASSTPPSCRRSWPPASTPTAGVPGAAGADRRLPRRRCCRRATRSLADPAVRRALNLGVDRPAMVDRAPRRRRRTGVRPDPADLRVRRPVDRRQAHRRPDGRGERCSTRPAGRRVPDGVRVKDGPTGAVHADVPGERQRCARTSPSRSPPTRRRSASRSPRRGSPGTPSTPRMKSDALLMGCGDAVRPGLRLVQAVRLAVRGAGLLQPRLVPLRGDRQGAAGRPRPGRPGPSQGRVRAVPEAARRRRPVGCSSPTCGTPTC